MQDLLSAEVIVAVLIGTALLVVGLPWLLMRLDRYAGLISEDEMHQQLGTYRQAAVQVAGGILLFGGFYLTWSEIKVREEGQVTDRFASAVRQLSHKDTEVRVGGVYALEQLAEDSPEDRWTIVKTLAAFVRNNAPTEPQEPRDAPLGLGPQPPPGDSLAVQEDIQAAVAALSRIPHRQNSSGQKVNLSNTDLSGIEIVGGDLSNIVLRGADLSHSKLIGVNLQGANLNYVLMQSSNLYPENPNLYSIGEDTTVNLSNASLTGADIVANLQNVNLSGATLRRADLEGSNLSGADLSEANLRSAKLVQTIFQPQTLGGAEFQKAVLPNPGCMPKPETVCEAASFERALVDKGVDGLDSLVVGSAVQKSSLVDQSPECGIEGNTFKADRLRQAPDTSRHTLDPFRRQCPGKFKNVDGVTNAIGEITIHQRDRDSDVQDPRNLVRDESYRFTFKTERDIDVAWEYEGVEAAGKSPIINFDAAGRKFISTDIYYGAYNIYQKIKVNVRK